MSDFEYERKPSRRLSTAELTLDLILSVCILFLIAYVVNIEFDFWSFFWAFLLTIVGYFVYYERLKEFGKDETLYWSMIGALGFFMTALVVGSQLTDSYLTLAVAFLTCVLSLWTKCRFMIVMTAFLIAYIAFKVFIANIPQQ